MKYVQWFSATCVVLAAFVLLPHDYGVIRDGTYGKSGIADSTNAPAAYDDQDVSKAPEDRFAWDEFASLVHPASESPEQKPEWVRWYNKCHAGLTGACPPDYSSEGCSKTSSEECPRIPADRSAAEIPRQVISDFNKLGAPDKQSRFLEKFGRAPELDSVLFNSVAADSIRRSNLGRRSSLDLTISQLDNQNISGANRHLPAGTFAFGSEIVKLIWEIIPDDGKIALPVYDPSNPSIPTGALQLRMQDEWKTRYKIDTNLDHSCPDVVSADAETVPLRCFYAFPIHTSQSCFDLSQDIRFVWCRAAVEDQNFLVFLVGFHIMKLTPANPDWVWSTYYWTRETNDNERGQGAKKWHAPWNHFHQVSTTAIRENAGDHAICYNPYLEGRETNGLKANCLSCHNFAAYAPNADKLDSGTEHGEEYPYPKKKRLQDEQEYFRGAVQTSFIWSISTSQSNPGGGQGPASFQNKLEKTLHEQFQSK